MKIDNEFKELIESMDFFKSKKNKKCNYERKTVHMNEKPFNILSKIYLSKSPLHFRDLVRKTNLPYSTVQGVIKKISDVLDIKIDGRNKYYSLKKKLDTNYLKQEIEIKITREFLKNNTNLIIFFEEVSKLNIPILIFKKIKSKKLNQKLDLNIISFSNKNIKLSSKLIPYKINHININLNDIKKFKLGNNYNEILKSHIIITGFDFILNEVFGK